MVFLSTIAFSIGIGVYHAVVNRKKTVEEYLLGSRELKIIPVSLSVTVSLVSANALLGYPAEVYVFGIQVMTFCIGVVFATLILAFFIVPLLHPLRLISIHEVSAL